LSKFVSETTREGLSSVKSQLHNIFFHTHKTANYECNLSITVTTYAVHNNRAITLL